MYAQVEDSPAAEVPDYDWKDVVLEIDDPVTKTTTTTEAVLISKTTTKAAPAASAATTIISITNKAFDGSLDDDKARRDGEPRI